MGRRLLRLTGLSDGATVAQRDAALVIIADAISEIQAFSLLHLNALPPLSHDAWARLEPRVCHLGLGVGVCGNNLTASVPHAVLVKDVRSSGSVADLPSRVAVTASAQSTTLR
jgi:hypothetical protein